jgi:hypothetical protein
MIHFIARTGGGDEDEPGEDEGKVESSHLLPAATNARH